MFFLIECVFFDNFYSETHKICNNITLDGSLLLRLYFKHTADIHEIKTLR